MQVPRGSMSVAVPRCAPGVERSPRRGAGAARPHRRHGADPGGGRRGPHTPGRRSRRKAGHADRHRVGVQVAETAYQVRRNEDQIDVPEGRRLATASPAFGNPLDGARVEYDPASQSTIVFDEAGRRPNPRLSSASTSSTALGSVESWLEELVFRTSDADARREALERSHGRPVGRVGRLSRYLQNRGEVSEELLADQATALPVEVNLRAAEHARGAHHHRLRHRARRRVSCAAASRASR